ncbi:hypothetical protein G6O69_18335 [Pseudenhygromyxa sp. WMMC2535]|uniref:hypothetical protein n=1 Tax=Pseudenhygromyxa sp. WMMC2535 TaxID=2712867 RepID=UPI001555DF6D|nr:hypothetical protein [Pseudenhygromyxa sp. WMMC2535]NVB39808.1 hypothetical protein [Pseudenhygromyxa sp. WMMC2535]
MSPPPSTVRKYLAESLKNDTENPGLLGSVTVVPNALMRGVMTAVLWVAGKERSGISESKADVPAAWGDAVKAWEAMGLQPPDFDPTTWSLPKEEDAEPSQIVYVKT